MSLARNVDPEDLASSGLKLVDPFTGDRRQWALSPTPLRPFRGVESKLAVAPAGGPFQSGAVVTGTGAWSVQVTGSGNTIAKIDANGLSYNPTFCEPAPEDHPHGPHGGFAFDRPGGAFNGDLIAVVIRNDGGHYGKLFRINSLGVATLIADLGPAPTGLGLGQRAEGVAIAPSTFGAHANKIIVGIEGTGAAVGGKVWAFDAAGVNTLVADVHSAAEDVQFVPAMGGTYFMTELHFFRETNNRILSVSSSQLLARVGQLIVLNEMSGEVWAVASTGGASYTQQVIGKVRRWTSEGLSVKGQASELEQACFAVLPPTRPTSWSTQLEVSPGSGFRTNTHVACCTRGDKLYVVAVSDGTGGFTAGKVYLNTRTISTNAWSGWVNLSFPGVTSFAPAAATQDGVLHVFAVDNATGLVNHKPGSLSWVALSGLTTRDAPAAALVGGWVVLAAIHMTTRFVNIIELRPGGQGWLDWQEVPGNDIVGVPPAVASFQEELYVIFVLANKVYIRARTVSGQWTEKAEVPVLGSTTQAVGAAGATPWVDPEPISHDLYLFTPGTADHKHYLNMASETGTWSGWAVTDNTGVLTDRAIAACVTTANPPVVYTFTKGNTTDKRVYWRRSPP